jgi:hypothetical protein
LLSIPAAPDPNLDLIHFAGYLHQHAGRGVRYIIVRAGGMVDAIPSAAHAPALKADELRTEAHMVKQLGPATVQDRVAVLVEPLLLVRRVLREQLGVLHRRVLYHRSGRKG